MTVAISVVLPVHNAGRFLREAVESVLAQTEPDFELILIDDGSTDGSPAIVDALAAHDHRIVPVHQDNAGLVATLNRGLEMARGEFVARMDADDICLPERFAQQLAHLRGHPDCLALGSAIILIDAEGHKLRDAVYPVGTARVADFMRTGSAFAHPAVMMRRAAVLAAGGYRAAFAHAEDYDLWLRLMERGSIDNLPDALLLYRQHPGQASVQHALAQAVATAIAAELADMRRAGMPEPQFDAGQPLSLGSLPALKLPSTAEASIRLAALQTTLRPDGVSAAAEVRETLTWIDRNAPRVLRGKQAQLTLWRVAAAARHAGQPGLAAQVVWTAARQDPAQCLIVFLALLVSKLRSVRS